MGKSGAPRRSSRVSPAPAQSQSRKKPPERLSQTTGVSDIMRTAITRANFSPNDLARFTERADRLYRSAQASKQTAEMMGGLRPIHQATQEQVRQHFLYVEALGRVNHTNADPERYAINERPEEIARDVEARAAARRRGAGARAVARKYGDKAAYNITGHHIKR